jgi:hypothetical protein
LPFGLGVIFALQGLASLFEALRFNLTPKTGDVHGAARPAKEQEARAAASGNRTAGQDFNDQRFSD